MKVVLPVVIGAIAFALIPLANVAQVYPVQSTPQLVPPYSVYLGDYATVGSENSA